MRAILLGAFLLACFDLAAQNNIIDSLEHQLKNRAKDTSRVKLLSELSYQYRNVEAEKALEYAQQALRLAQSINYHKGEIQALRNVGLGLYKLGRYDTAITICDQAITLAEQYNELRLKADALNTQGNIYFYKGDFLRSVDAFSKTLEIYNSLNEHIDQAGALANMGVILENQGKYPEALSNFQKAFKIFEKENHRVGQATVLFSMANIYSDISQIDKALDLYNQAAELDRESGDLNGLALTLSSIAGILEIKGDTATAISYYHQSIDLFKKSNANCRLDNPYNNLGDIFLSNGRMDSAYFYFQKALKVAEECKTHASVIGVKRDLGDYFTALKNYSKAGEFYDESYELATQVELKPEIAESAREIYALNKRTGNYKKALQYLEIARQIEDEIFNAENTRELALLEAEYEFEKERDEIAYQNRLESVRLNNKIERQRSVQIIIAISLIIVVILMAVIAFLYNKKRKANIELATINEEVRSQNEEILQQRDYIEEKNKIVEKQKLELMINNKNLEELNIEKNELIGIVAHDLKSPLNQIQGLINVSRIEKDPTSNVLYLEKIQEAANRSVQMIDHILDINAIENRELKLEKQQVQLSELLAETISDFKIIAKEKSIDLQASFTAPDVILTTDPRILKEITENLLSNAIKFTPPGGLVKVGLEKLGENVRISVVDNGPGISESEQQLIFNKYQRASNIPTGGEKSSGLGLAIVKRYIKELKGEVFCESTVGEGTKFILQFVVTKS